MKKSALTSLVVLTLCGLAHAGSDSKEMKQTVATPPSCPINWTGFYLGLHAGYGWGKGDTSVDPLPTAAAFINLAPTTFQPDVKGFLGGAQLGYNHQIGCFVFGLETDFSGTSMDGSSTLSPIIQNNGTPFPGAGNNITVSQDVNWMGTLRGRLGFTPTCRLLLYGTGGLAYGDVDYFGNTEFRPVGTVNYPASASETRVGWTVGGGAELALTTHWSVKLEYLYFDLGDKTITANPVGPLPPFQVRYNWETTAHTVNAGLNFKF
ncbi:MAG: outer rane immunogenic protein [Verrucomicrobiota bacterium]|jgi:outer membrane immunogenic protein